MSVVIKIIVFLNQSHKKLIIIIYLNSSVIFYLIINSTVHFYIKDFQNQSYYLINNYLFRSFYFIRINKLNYSNITSFKNDINF